MWERVWEGGREGERRGDKEAVRADKLFYFMHSRNRSCCLLSVLAFISGHFVACHGNDICTD